MNLRANTKSKKGQTRHRKDRLYYCGSCDKYRAVTASETPVAQMVEEKHEGKRNSIWKTCNDCR